MCGYTAAEAVAAEATAFTTRQTPILIQFVQALSRLARHATLIRLSDAITEAGMLPDSTN